MLNDNEGKHPHLTLHECSPDHLNQEEKRLQLQKWLQERQQSIVQLLAGLFLVSTLFQESEIHIMP